jgi:predicted RNA methylase
LDGPLTLTFENDNLTALNDYRQAYHAWSMSPGFGENGERLDRELVEASAKLAKVTVRLAEKA